MVTGGWFDGMTAAHLQREAARYIGQGQGIVLEPWGMAAAGPGQHDLAHRVEVGERVVHDARRENDEDRLEREDWVVAKALRAHPSSFLDLLHASST